MKILLLIPFLFASLVHAQTWQKVAKDGDSVTFGALPVTLRYGTPQGTVPTLPGAKTCSIVGGCWNGTATVPVGGAVSLTVAPSPILGTNDPAYGTVKELDVLETAAAQTVTVNGVKVTVPALPPTSTTYLLTCKVVVPAGTPPATLPCTGATLVKQP